MKDIRLNSWRQLEVIVSTATARMNRLGNKAAAQVSVLSPKAAATAKSIEAITANAILSASRVFSPPTSPKPSAKEGISPCTSFQPPPPAKRSNRVRRARPQTKTTRKRLRRMESDLETIEEDREFLSDLTISGCPSDDPFSDDSSGSSHSRGVDRGDYRSRVLTSDPPLPTADVFEGVWDLRDWDGDMWERAWDDDGAGLEDEEGEGEGEEEGTTEGDDEVPVYRPRARARCVYDAEDFER